MTAQDGSYLRSSAQLSTHAQDIRPSSHLSTEDAERRSLPPSTHSFGLFFMTVHESTNVAIFWDYENCAPPYTAPGYDIVSNIREIAHEYGSVKLFKAYLELSEHASSRSLSLRSDLQSCGVSLTDCPHNGRKDVADKMMIVDMLAYAIDTPEPATIIIISGDRDFVYAVSVLRLRKYRIVLIAPKNSHASLRSLASAVLDWEADVLGKTAVDVVQRPVVADVEAGTSPHGLYRRTQSTVSTLAPSSPKPKASRRSSFRDTAQSPSPTVQSLRPAAIIMSPASRNVSVQTDIFMDDKHESEHVEPLEARSLGSVPPSPSETLQGSNVDSPGINVTVSTMFENAVHTKEMTDLDLPLKNLEEQSECSSYYSAASSFEAEAVVASPAPPLIPTAIASLSASVSVRETTTSHEVHKDVVHVQSDPASSGTLRTTVFTQVSESLAGSLPEDATYDKDECDTKPSASPSNARKGLNSGTTSRSTESTTATFVRVAQIETSPVKQPPTLVIQSSPALPSRAPLPEPKPRPGISQPALPRLAPHFVSLVKVLRGYRDDGCDDPMRGWVAQDLLSGNKNIFKSAGVDRWKQYAELAKKAGIITLGTDDSGPWVSLTPQWRDGPLLSL